MAQFAKWCVVIKESVNGHEMTIQEVLDYAGPEKIWME